MKPLLEGAMELPLGKYRIRIDELEKEKAQDKTAWEQDKAALEKEVKRLKELLKEKDNQ